MGISKFELMEAMEKIAPIKLAEAWDNCGMQIDLDSKQINKILVTLEITKEIIKEAKNLEADFIVTHHPLYFSSFKNIDHNNIIGNYTVDLIQQRISVFSAHTNFDKAQFGNNFYLANLLNLKNIKDFQEFGDNYIGVLGELPEEMMLKDIISDVKNILNLQTNEIKVIGNLENVINKIGLCTGAGIDMIEIAAANSCQLFITGDVKYHDAIKSKEMGMNVIDAGHYGTEKIFIPNMAMQLKDALEDKVEIFEAEVNINPFDFL
nr:Nif3-like dinuclear metal center hexameric protein [uncultured Aminipila sp.]